ncbi:hypothetical protein Dimus_004182, partial [Dionaea muscipula]
PSRRRGRSRSPGGRRERSPAREGSEERRAKIEQWNREKELTGQAKSHTGAGNNGYSNASDSVQNGD